ncbi:uncharacterized protein LOC118817317 [Colossoma macropomum]|uniref:uncharacterized protein LOC118817317 n=1 Tax=Colossoma macropomum TaxID=42526 RepID=UPI0018646B55|nr:uncharacterized protein LOC118817317 [Colossoma macropomum]
MVASAIFYGVVCWGSSISTADRKRLDRLIKRASSVMGSPLDPVQVVGDRRMLARLASMLENSSHPMHETLAALGSSFSDRLLHPKSHHCLQLKAHSTSSQTTVPVAMVCAGIKSLLLVFMLTIRADAIDPNVLAQIIKFTRDTIALNGEYAFLITTTEEACGNYNIFVTKLNKQLQQIHNFFVTSDERGIIGTDDIIAARPDDNFHAEHWILFNNDNEIRKRTQNPNTCVLFFTNYSPCVDRCASPDNAQSIIKNLREKLLFRNINADWKAFVFYTVYDKDETRIPELQQALTTIEEFLPVFRCTSYSQNGRLINVCYICASQMTDCLWVPRRH